jgi:hypothetical protein
MVRLEFEKLLILSTPKDSFSTVSS